MKKKIITLALIVCLITLSIAGATTAYFTDTKSVTNTFTSGNSVMIELTMNNADAGTPVAEMLYPGVPVDMTTTLKNVGEDPIYAGVIITLSNTGNVIADDANTTGVNEILARFPELNTTAYKYKILTDTTAKTVTIYLVRTTALVKNDTDLVFQNFVPDAAWTNEQMAACGGMTIKVDAYATQTAGMTGTALDALKAAFDAFDGVTLS